MRTSRSEIGTAKMILSYQNLSIFMLFCVTVIVTGVTENNVDVERKDSHERKAIPLHKSRPLPPDHEDSTTHSNSISKLTTESDTNTATSSVLPTSATTVMTVVLTTESNVTTNSTTNVSETTTSTPTTVPTFHPITAPPHNDSCQFLLEGYGRLASNFTNCAIIHAKPFLFCENCVKEYVATVKAYKTITADEGKLKCKDTLLLSDRVQIVNQLHMFVLGLWDDGNCNSCFDDVNDCQANKTCSLSLETRQFMDTYQDTMDCFNQYETKTKNRSVLATVCSNCSEIYHLLNERYEDTGPLDDTCMDVVELMNHTRIKWSTDLNCIQFKRDVGTVIALGIFIGLLPIFFYCAVRVHAEKQTRRYMRQKRLSYAQPNIQSNIQYPHSPTHR